MPGRPLPTGPLATRFPFFYGWIMVGVATLAVFASGPGQTFNVSVFVDPILAEMGWSRTFVSGLYTAGSLSAAALMPFVGRLIDRLGSRSILTAVALLFGLSLIGLSGATHPLHFGAGFFAIRLFGQGALVLISTVLVAVWFRRLRARATAITLLGMGAGTLVFPPLTHLLIESLGWRNAWLALGLLLWGVLVLPAVLVVRRSPETVGLRPDGGIPATTSSTEGGAVAARPDTDWPLGAAMQTPSFWLLLLATATPSFTLTALPFHHVSVMAARGLDSGTAVGVLAVLGPATAAGTLSAGYLAGRLSVRGILLGGQGLMLSGVALNFAIQSPWQAGLYVAFLGSGGGTIATVGPVLWADYFGRRHLGSIRAIAHMAIMVFAAIAPLPVGLLFDVTGGYAVALLLMLATLLIAIAAALFAAPPVPRSQEV